MSQLPVKDLSQISEFDGSLNQFIVQATAGTKIMAINVLANAFVRVRLIAQRVSEMVSIAVKTLEALSRRRSRRVSETASLMICLSEIFG